MPREPKVYFYTASAPYGLDARHRDGRPIRQVYFVVRARTKKAARELFGIGSYEFNLYVSEVDGHKDINGFPENVVYVKPLDPGGTVRGLSEWQPLEISPAESDIPPS